MVKGGLSKLFNLTREFKKMKFEGLNIQHVEVKDDRLLLVCDSKTIDVGQNLGIVYQTVNLSRETLRQIE